MGQTSPGRPGRPSVVVTPTKPDARSAVRPHQTIGTHHDGCVRPGLGSPLRTESNAGSLATKPTKHTHKPQRAVGSPEGDRELGNGAGRGNHPILDGQPYGRVLHLKARGDKITLHDPDSKEVVSTCKLVKHLHTSKLHIRGAERRGRHVFESRPDS